jgi:hypothetical protein
VKDIPALWNLGIAGDIVIEGRRGSSAGVLRGQARSRLPSFASDTRWGFPKDNTKQCGDSDR